VAEPKIIGSIKPKSSIAVAVARRVEFIDLVV
jgi:hypothetical protein